MNQKNIDVINICLDIAGAYGNEKSKADITEAKRAFEIAAEKQIPKPPVSIYNYEIDEDVLRCPTCETQPRVYEYENYCPNCGQVINWEEE